MAAGAFGKGEILRQPTAFRFASGGAFRNGIAGEAGPEGALPLKRMSDGRLGVYADFSGAAGGNSGGVMVAITVNLNRSGEGREASQQGDDAGDMTALAKKLESVTRSVIVAEKRPGGLLAGTA